MRKIYNPTFFKKSAQMKINFLILIIGILTFSACKKETTDTTAYTALTVFNASPTLSTYDFYLNDTKFNSVAIPFGGAVAYKQLTAGTYSLKLTTAGRAENLLTKNVALAEKTFNSYYVVNRTASLDGLLMTDDLSATSTTTAFVRFINLSPDAPALDLAITGSTTLTTNKAYKTAGAFVPVNAGTYSFDIKNTIGGTVQATLAGVALVANGHYTIISRGLLAPVAGVEHPISLQVIINN
jgi:hypothetical protein